MLRRRLNSLTNLEFVGKGTAISAFPQSHTCGILYTIFRVSTCFVVNIKRRNRVAAPLVSIRIELITRILGNAEVLAGDVFDLDLPARSFDLVAANPPYVAESERELVMPEVLAFEPAQALFSGREGLAHIEAVAKLASRMLREGGILVLEHGFRQAAGVAEVLEDLGFDKIIAKKDLAGLDRVTRGVYKCPRCC